MPARPIALILVAAFSLAACASPPEAAAPVAEAAPAAAAVAPLVPDPALANGAGAGVYTLDKSHASLVLAVNHLGFSNYVGQFTRFDATLTIDPAAPEAATLTATVDPTSLTIPTPPEGFLATLLGPDWLNAATFPEIRFVSTQITQTGPADADVTGDLTFLGATAPVSFAVHFNGAYPGYLPYDPNARAGFHASGSLDRSAFGMTYGLPPEGSAMGVGDEVKFWIDAEFTGPPTPETPDAAPEETP